MAALIADRSHLPTHLAARVGQLEADFAVQFGRRPELLVRVPGRVNLIGEHIDYCGYAVHPMAIEQEIMVAVSSAESGLELRNQDSETYPAFRLDSLANITILTDFIHWSSYFLCGLKGVYEEQGVEVPKGLRCLLSGRIPPSSGLSSSSAVVVSAAIAAVATNQLTVSREELAALCARAERYIGTQGGGMDQAIELLAQAGRAKLIEFGPLRSEDVSLPDGAVFVVANSLQEKNKAASNEFNTRVVECRLAAKLLASSLIQGDRWRTILKLKEVQVEAGKELAEMADLVEALLTKEVYSRDEVLAELGISEEYLRQEILTPNTQEVVQFRLKQRARHVFTEAARVYKFRDICNAAGDDALAELGALMTASHSSCKLDYECSAPGLDRLVDMALGLGALGARLTGAGWGGCAVMLVPAAQIEGLLAGLRDQFYQTKDDLQNIAFVTGPSEGALVWTL